MGSVGAEEVPVSVSGESSKDLTVTGTNAAWCMDASEEALAP
jgi:hypothetical protein